MSDLDHDGSIVVPNGDLVAPFETADGPHALHAVIQSILESICGRMPNPHGPVFGPRDNDGQLRVEKDAADIVRVPFESGNASLGSIIPHFDGVVISSTDQIGLIATSVVADAIHAALVTFQGEMRSWAVETPHLHGTIQRG